MKKCALFFTSAVAVSLMVALASLKGEVDPVFSSFATGMGSLALLGLILALIGEYKGLRGERNALQAKLTRIIEKLQYSVGATGLYDLSQWCFDLDELVDRLLREGQTDQQALALWRQYGENHGVSETELYSKEPDEKDQGD